MATMNTLVHMYQEATQWNEIVFFKVKKKKKVKNNKVRLVEPLLFN